MRADDLHHSISYIASRWHKTLDSGSYENVLRARELARSVTVVLGDGVKSDKIKRRLLQECRDVAEALITAHGGTVSAAEEGQV